MQISDIIRPSNIHSQASPKSVAVLVDPCKKVVCPFKWDQSVQMILLRDRPAERDLQKEVGSSG